MHRTSSQTTPVATPFAMPVVAALLLILVGFTTLAGAQVDATIQVDDTRRQGTHSSGNLLLFSPDPLQQGSSLSHWDTSTFPDLLMEPSITPDLPFLGLDITPPAMQDMFWQAGSSNISIFPLQEPATGFDDPRPFGGAPGNPATTLGEARVNLFNAVLGAWANTLESDADIDVIVVWQDLFCDPNQGATLGAAGPTIVFIVPPGGAGLPFTSDTAIPAALAEALFGEDLTGAPDDDGGDIFVLLNQAIDDECLGEGTGFYYGLDGNEPAGLIGVGGTLLHELGHGLGFANFTNESTGEQLGGVASIFDRFTRDQTTGKLWSEMTDKERRESAERFRQVTWDGALANQEAVTTLAQGVPVLTINSPAEIAGTYEVGTANFGPGITASGLSGEIACLDDGVADTSRLNGCTPATNPGDLAGKIALIDRGGCAFTDKVANVQSAGAIGAIIANNAGSGVFNMGGDDPLITIPSVMVGATDGRLIREQACGSSATHLLDGRFQITASWSSSDNSGVGEAVGLTDASGYFYFFNKDNIEITAKMLNACELPGFNSFWFFAAAMTNLEIDLTVVDTRTGTSVVYHNELGTTFDPVLDTRSFVDCP